MGVDFASASSEYLTLSAPHTNTTNVTIMGWFISGDTPTDDAYFGFGPSSSFGGYSIDQSANDNGAAGDYWSAHLPGIVIRSSDNTITQDIWTHVCISRGASAWAMHINGVAQSISTSSNPNNTIAQAAIGARPEGGGYVKFLEGSAAECRSWTTQLSTAQINVEMRSRFPRMAIGSLTSWLPLNNAALPAAYPDHSGNGKNATPVNTPTPGQHTHF